MTLVGAEDQIASTAGRPARRCRHLGPGQRRRTDDRGRVLRAGRIAGHAVETAASRAGGEVDAIVTAPAHKHALHLAGFPFPGHTEWLAQLAGGVDVAMMLSRGRAAGGAGDDPRAVPRRARAAHARAGDPRRVGPPDAALRDWFGIAAPRLALCAVNPHAGEGGLFGDEEERVLRPAARRSARPDRCRPDTVFVRALRGEFDAVLAPYHDVGMTAIKVAAFGRAVNVTLGLPFPRTSPDHGTALDIAGTGQADASSMRAAIELAAQLATARPAPHALAPRRRPRSVARLRLALSPSRPLAPYRPSSSRSIKSRYASSLSFWAARLATSTAPHCSTVSRSTSPFALSVFPVSTRSTIQCERLSSGATSTDPLTWMMSTGPARGAEVRLREPRILGGHPGGDAAGQGGIGASAGRGHRRVGRSRSRAPAARARRRRSRAARRCR